MSEQTPEKEGAPSPAEPTSPAVALQAPVTREMVFEALKPVEDPEIHLGIIDLGLVYGAEVSPDGKQVKVKLTLTSPACPYGPMLIEQVKLISGRLPGVEKAEVQLVWEPPWDPRTMAADHVKDILGIW
jgi:metal-sulfur cluster biosynthetic enzyme